MAEALAPGTGTNGAPSQAQSASIPTSGARETPQQQPAAQQQAPASGGTPQFPWQSEEQFRDAAPEKVWDSYKEAQRQITQLGQYRSAAEQWNNFANQFGGSQNLAQLVQLGLQAWNAQQQGGQQQAPQGNQPDPYETWENLTPREQARMQADLLRSEIQQYGRTLYDQLRNELAQGVQQQTGGLQRQWEIFNLVMQKKAEDPTLNVEQTLSTMLQLANSTPAQLMSLAVNNMGMENRVKREAEAMAQARIADFQQQQRNQSLASLTKLLPVQPGTQQAPTYATSADRNQAILRKMIEQGVIGPEHV